ncbi:MAG TPA: VTC domain-containing protein [Candidatus Methanoperedens sp.]|nr:VTC domain-containing protein [Candidatus Methanoperedens sp.]
MNLLDFCRPDTRPESDSRIPSAETKFVATADLEERVLAWLRHVCLPDPVHPEAQISTLYYDTPALDSWREKTGGEFIKTKCRLRWYDPELSSDPALRRAFLEIKRKIGRGRRKTRVGLHLPRGVLDGAGLDHPLFSEIFAGHAASLREWLRSGLQPAAVVEYRRRRFVCPFTLSRVCLDTVIGLGRVNERLLPRLGPTRLGTIVLEIKGDSRAAVPWLATLQAAGVRQRSFSKYGACISRLLKED